MPRSRMKVVDVKKSQKADINVDRIIGEDLHKQMYTRAGRCYGLLPKEWARALLSGEMQQASKLKAVCDTATTY